MYIEKNTFFEAYKEILSKLIDKSQKVSFKKARGQKFTELRNCNISIKHTTVETGFESDVRPYPIDYLKKELYWYYSGSNLLSEIESASKFWRNITNPDGETVNSAYGYLIFEEKNQLGITEWDWAKRQLQSDKETRQSIIHFNKPSHKFYGNRDFPCTLNGVFHIEDNKLNLNINQRSCDVKTGYIFDVPFFMSLMHHMRIELLKDYPNLSLGKFTHYINSLHIYKKDIELLSRMLNSECFKSKDVLPYMEIPTRNYFEKIRNEEIDPKTIEKDKFLKFIL